MTRWSTTIFSISVFGHVYTYMHSYTAAHIPSNLHTYLPTYMHTSTINPYILDRKYSPPTKKCYPLHTRLNTYRHSYHCLSVWVCMCTYIYIPHMYDHVCSNLFRVDRQMKNVRRTEVDWCHILVTPGVGKAGVAASTEPPFVTNRTNYFEATN